MGTPRVGLAWGKALSSQQGESTTLCSVVCPPCCVHLSCPPTSVLSTSMPPSILPTPTPPSILPSPMPPSIPESSGSCPPQFFSALFYPAVQQPLEDFSGNKAKTKPKVFCQIQTLRDKIRGGSCCCLHRSLSCKMSTGVEPPREQAVQQQPQTCQESKYQRETLSGIKFLSSISCSRGHARVGAGGLDIALVLLPAKGAWCPLALPGTSQQQQNGVLAFQKTLF